MRARNPNEEPWCRLDCGCIVSPFGAVHHLGDMKGEKRVWKQPCRITGEWRRIVEEKIIDYHDGGKCTLAGRLL